MTDKEAKKFYNSTMWKHKRMQILERDHYECQDCRKRLRDAVAAGDILRGEEKKIRRAEEVHHIVELKEHPELGLEEDNLISLCVDSAVNLDKLRGIGFHLDEIRGMVGYPLLNTEFSTERALTKNYGGEGSNNAAQET